MRRLYRGASRLLADPLAPTVVLCLILVLSLYARVLHLGAPCSGRCQTPAEHTLIFDERYYVNAARVIAGIEPAAGEPYAGAPRGKDPNAEHPQLAKLIMAGGIDLFGDNPRGWRLGSVLFGLLAMLALFALVRAAGGGAWFGVGAVAVMALDNLLLVHGRIATLDIYAVAMMLVAATLYLRGSPLLAGVALGVGACMKEVALYLLAVIALLEALRFARARWGPSPRPAQSAAGERVAGEAQAQATPSPTARSAPAPTVSIGAGWRALALFVGASVVSFLGLLWLLDALVPAYDPNTHITYAGSPFSHIGHILHYAQLLTSQPGATGISSTPWQWLLDAKTIDYAKVAVNSLVGGKIVASHPTIFFQGAINPFIVFVAIPALFAGIAAAWREGEALAALGACWCLGTFLPFVLASQVTGRTSYLYYMAIVLPGIYILAARLFSPRRIGLAATLGWSVALVYGFGDLYPLRTLL
jgi:4-amino-4-deoxy-L-arabinose transferase-like glycosyltransferase